MSEDVKTEPIDEDIPVVPSDLLVNMFMRQLGHKQAYDQMAAARGDNRVGVSQWGNLNNPAVQAELRTTAGYVVEELYEAIGLLKNKPWKQTPRETDAEAFYKELADTWHFWLELLLIAGMTPDLVQKYYFKIAESNDNRRENGY